MGPLQQIIAATPFRDPMWRFPAEGGEYPLSDLLAQSERLAAGLAEQGVKADDRVITLFDTGSAAVTCLLAIWHLGAVAVPLRPQRINQSGKGLVPDVIRICAAKAIVHTAPQVTFNWPGGTLDLSYQQLLRNNAKAVPRADRALRDLALIQFTSGSTGRPRGVRVRHDMVLTQLRQLSENYRAEGPVAVPQSVGSWLPIYHDMGLFIGMLLPLFCGADALLAPPEYYVRNPARWFRALSDQRCDLSFSTSSVLAATLRGTKRLTPQDCDLSRLVLYIAAEKISPAVMDDLSRRLGPLGLRPQGLRTGYGMAEYALGCTSSLSGPVPRQHVRIAGDVVTPCPTSANSLEFVTIGRPNSGCDLAIRDPGGRRLPDWRLGEITVAGSCLTEGYENDAAATDKALGQGYLRSGDLGFRVNGEVYFVGRKDDTMTVAGRHIVPADIEHEIEALSFVGAGRALLFGTEAQGADPSRQILLIESRSAWTPEQATERIAAIRQMTRDRFGFVPSDIVPVPRGTVEKTSSGKKRTRVIKARWLRGEIFRLSTEDA